MNPFKNASGKLLTKGLFWETRDTLNPQCMYTLKKKDHLSYPSLYRLYMEEVDPTEYTFANKHLDGWEHWKELSSSPFFIPHVTEWREEFAVRLKALALLQIQGIAEGNSPAKLTANKLLLDGGWQPKETRRVGRPEKEKIIQAAESLSTEEQHLLEGRLN